jgi:RsiW-degrading membrane proteinase PrsW (M82 family)
MAGEAVQCMKCGKIVAFPAPAGQAPARAAAAPLVALASPFGEEPPAVAPGPEGAAGEAAAGTRRRPCEYLYWGLLLALLPLLTVLLHEDQPTVKQRFEKTMEKNTLLKKEIMRRIEAGEMASPDDLFRLLPGHRLDDMAHLSRESQQHLVYAGLSAWCFFLFVGVLMAWRITPAWMLVLNALFTATFGIAILFLLHDFIGHGYQLTLTPDEDFITNLLGFTFVVGLGEELCKSLPVIFYIRTFRGASWRGAYLWGMASGIGFGVAEGITYAGRQYNGIATADIYLTRFVACVALHAVWSASVGITLFQSRRLVGKVLGAVLYGGDFRWEELVLPTLRVLGVAMVLHGLYDTLLTQNLVPLALLVALLSFGWLGWQVEGVREREIRELAAAGLLAPVESLPLPRAG